MAPLPPVVSVIKWEFNQTCGGRGLVNILHSSFAGFGGSTPDLLVCATAAYAAWSDHLLVRQHDTLTLTGCKATDLSTDSSPVAEHDESTAGSAGGVVLPNSTAMCISWDIARRYRGGHPRTYLCGQTNDYMASPIAWDPAVVAAEEVVCNAFMTAMNAISHGSYGAMELVNVSYRTGGAARVTPITDVITGLTIHPRIDSQRRRLGKETT